MIGVRHKNLKIFLKYIGIDRGRSLALLRIRLGPVIQLFNMSRGVWEGLQGMMGSCVRVNGFVRESSSWMFRGSYLVSLCVFNKYCKS